MKVDVYPECDFKPLEGGSLSLIWLGRKEGCVPVVPWKPPELPAGTGLLGTGDSGASCVFETCWGVPVGQVKWEGEISLSSIFLLLATG